MNVERRSVSLTELRAKTEDGEARSKIEGYAAVFNKYSEDLGGFREIIKPGAFKKALKISDVRGLHNHDSNYVWGRTSSGTLRLKEDGDGLHIENDPPDTQWARDLIVSINRGDINQMSFGFTVGDGGDEWNEGKDGVVTRTINEFKELFDISTVVYPAYPDTAVALRSLTEWRNKNVEPEPAGATADADDEQVAVPMHKVKANHRRRLNELKQKQITTKE